LKDKEEKSTISKAVDPQTRLILFKMVNNGFLETVDGTIASGKEAVILHADGTKNRELGRSTSHSHGAIAYFVVNI